LTNTEVDDAAAVLELDHFVPTSFNLPLGVVHKCGLGQEWLAGRFQLLDTFRRWTSIFSVSSGGYHCENKLPSAKSAVN
jgi:hypothetical protein